MAKKVRRVKKKRRQKKSVDPVTEGVATIDQDSEAAAEQKISSTEQFRLEYAYVVKDLRRVLILAAIMFTLLIVLNLLLQ